MLMTKLQRQGIKQLPVKLRRGWWKGWDGLGRGCFGGGRGGAKKGGAREEEESLWGLPGVIVMVTLLRQ